MVLPGSEMGFLSGVSSLSSARRLSSLKFTSPDLEIGLGIVRPLKVFTDEGAKNGFIRFWMESVFHFGPNQDGFLCGFGVCAAKEYHILVSDVLILESFSMEHSVITPAYLMGLEGTNHKDSEGRFDGNNNDEIFDFERGVAMLYQKAFVLEPMEPQAYVFAGNRSEGGNAYLVFDRVSQQRIAMGAGFSVVSLLSSIDGRDRCLGSFLDPVNVDQLRAGSVKLVAHFFADMYDADFRCDIIVSSIDRSAGMTRFDGNHFEGKTLKHYLLVESRFKGSRSPLLMIACQFVLMKLALT